jgi:hypothetical protein
MPRSDTRFRAATELADILLLSGVNHPDPAPVIAAYRRRNPRAICVVGMGARGAAYGSAGSARSRTTGRWSTATGRVTASRSASSRATCSTASRSAAVQRGQLLARHTCTLLAGDDRFLTRRSSTSGSRRCAASSISSERSTRVISDDYFCRQE